MPVTRSPRGTPSFFAAQTIEAPSALIRGHSLTIDASSGSASIRLTLEALITTMLGRYAPRDDLLDFIHRLVKRDGVYIRVQNWITIAG